jgi:hypothetical protein
MDIRNLFTSNSNFTWKSYWKAFIALSLLLCLLIYGAFYLIDPYDCYPFSIKAQRAPVSSDARYFHTMLARSNQFDSAIIGASTARELRPEQLDPLFHSKFVNLSFNAASAYEQSKILALFVKHHREIKTIIWGLDFVWYKTADRYTKFARPDEDFPEWLYGSDPCKRPLPFNLKNYENSMNQLLFMLGLKQFEYGLDGYTTYARRSMTLDEKRLRIYGSTTPQEKKTVAPAINLSQEKLEALSFPAEKILKESLDSLPIDTKKILFFVPYHFFHQPADGSYEAAVIGEFKQRLSRLVKQYQNIHLLDFMFRSDMTTNDAYYLDKVHTTVEGGTELARLIYRSMRERASIDGYVRYLGPIR